MHRIIITIFTLLSVFLAGGCTIVPEGKETGIPYLIREYNIIQQSQRPGGVVPVPQISSEPEKTAVQPVMTKFPAENSDINQKTVKKVFLTFDDGPEVTTTPAILDILDRYGVKATFFVIGTCVEKEPDILRDIVRRGHVVGNHTYNHKYKDLYSVKGGFINSLKINEELIYRTVGLKPYIVRDPGGKIRNNWPVRKALGENKYWLVEWNVDSYDSRKPQFTAPQIVENVRLQINNPRIWGNMIVLFHDGKGHANTVEALPAIIEMLKAEGFSFEVVK